MFKKKRREPRLPIIFQTRGGMGVEPAKIIKRYSPTYCLCPCTPLSVLRPSPSNTRVSSPRHSFRSSSLFENNVDKSRRRHILYCKRGRRSISFSSSFFTFVALETNDAGVNLSLAWVNP